MQIQDTTGQPPPFETGEILPALWSRAYWRRWWPFLPVLLLVLRAAAPWWVDQMNFPNESASVRSLYRQDMPETGEITYYPEIRSLSEGCSGERYTKERFGKGVRAFPVGGILPNALLFACCKEHSFFLADVLVFSLFYFVLLALLRTWPLPVSWPEVLAAAIAAGLYQPAWFFLNKLLPMGLLFWSWRMPDPFVGTIYLAGCFLVMRWISLKRVSPVIGGLALGVCNGLLLQTDVYEAFVLLPTSGIFIASRWFGGGGTAAMRGIGAFACSVSLVSAPFLWQRSQMNPDVAGRLGAIHWEVSKMPPFWEFYSNPTRNLFLAAFASSLVICLTRPLKKYTPDAWLWPLLLVLAWFSPYYSVGLLHFVVQPVHFDMRSLPLISSYVLLMSVIALGLAIYATFGLKRLFSFGALGVAALTALYSMRYVQTLKGKKYGGPVFAMSWNNKPGYREDFGDLSRALGKMPANAVLQCDDQQVMVWWETYHDKGWFFCPSAFSSTLPDAELERRYLMVDRLVGIKDEEFLDDLNHRGWLVFHFGYMANRYFKRGQDEDFDAKDLQRLRKTELLDLFSQAIPMSKQKQLHTRYSQMTLLPADPPLPDIFVVRTGQDKPPLHIYGYTEAYANHTFGIWILNQKTGL